MLGVNASPATSGSTKVRGKSAPLGPDSYRLRAYPYFVCFRAAFDTSVASRRSFADHTYPFRCRCFADWAHFDSLSGYLMDGPRGGRPANMQSIFACYPPMFDDELPSIDYQPNQKTGVDDHGE
jgi:hypothetical protein